MDEWIKPMDKQMKSRAESLEPDLEKLMDAFSEISRIGAKIAVESTSTSVTSAPSNRGTRGDGTPNSAGLTK